MSGGSRQQAYLALRSVFGLFCLVVCFVFVELGVEVVVVFDYVVFLLMFVCVGVLERLYRQTYYTRRGRGFMGKNGGRREVGRFKVRWPCVALPPSPQETVNHKTTTAASP